MVVKVNTLLRKWYELDSKALNNLARKYEQNDKELFDAFIDLREMILRRLGRGMG